MSRCNFTDPSTGMTHQEIIDDLQENITAQGAQIYRLTKGLLDSSLLLQAICAGVARWEFFTDDKARGEVCCNGLRYSTRLDELQLPILTDHIRHALKAAIENAEKQS
jgi:hypothetical protein